ncbi:hypothetical protein D3C77_721220 [compost metagenome]
MRSAWMTMRPSLYKAPMAFLKLPLLTPNRSLISCGSLLSLTGSTPLASLSLARILSLRLLARSWPIGCRLRAILPSLRISLM